MCSSSGVQLPRGGQTAQRAVHSQSEWQIHAEEIIKELTATNNDDPIASGGVLVWAKWIEVQRVQAAVLNTLTESRQFDKVKV